MLFKYIIKNTALKHGKTVTFMPKPIFQDNGSGMHHQSLWTDGVPLFYDESGYAQLSDLGRWYIGGLLAPRPDRVHQPDHQLLPAPGARLQAQSTWSSPSNRSARPTSLYSRSPKAKRVQFRSPTRPATPTWRSQPC